MEIFENSLIRVFLEKTIKFNKKSQILIFIFTSMGSKMSKYVWKYT